MPTGSGYSEQDFEKTIQQLTNDLDMSDENVADKVADALRRGASIIVEEQRRLIRGRSSILADNIKASRIKLTKKGKATITCGYDSDAIKEHFEGLIMEFGRPGKSSDGTDKNGKKIGKVDPTPHIFRGFDNVIDDAVDAVFDELAEVIKW